MTVSGAVDLEAVAAGGAVGPAFWPLGNDDQLVRPARRGWRERRRRSGGEAAAVTGCVRWGEERGIG